MKNKVLGISLFFANFVQAQTIQFDFPHFAGTSYVFCVFQGSQKDTILAGILDHQGKTQFSIPLPYKGYVGMSQWALEGGGGLDMIINGENFGVGSPEERPSSENIRYTQSPENVFLTTHALYQQTVLSKVTSLQQVQQNYHAKDPFHAVLSNEFKQQTNAFSMLQNEIDKSPLYAARYQQIYNFLMGITDSFSVAEAEKASILARFARTKLDMDALYTSALWDDWTQAWMDMQSKVIQNDTQLVEDTKAILKRIRSNTVYTAFSEKMVKLYAQQGKDDALAQLILEIMQSGRINKTSNLLTKATNGQVGSIAKPIEGIAKSTTEQATLLLFHESGCGACETEIQQLKRRYPKLKETYRIVTIASDGNQKIFDTHASQFPWSDKLCDLQGTMGVNFVNYGVIGTPTLIVIDKKGVITGRYAQLIDAVGRY